MSFKLTFVFQEELKAMVREEHKKIDEEKAKENVKKTPKKENKTTEDSGGEK